MTTQVGTYESGLQAHRRALDAAYTAEDKAWRRFKRDANDDNRKIFEAAEKERKRVAHAMAEYIREDS